MKNKICVYFWILISLFFAISAFCACTKGKNINLSPETNLPINDSMMTSDTAVAVPAGGAKFLALGDSYTIGQSVSETERFPAQTVQLLNGQRIKTLKPEYIATTGWTTTNLIDAINAKNPAKDFDIVTLLIGVNDQYHNEDTTGYRARFSELLSKSVEFANGKKKHVFVLSIPDYSATPFVYESNKAKVSAQIDQFNAINKEVTVKNGITYVDITPSTRLASVDPLLIANDGLHPSGKEYAVWANMLAPLIRSIFK